jgi:hypothetical protein
VCCNEDRAGEEEATLLFAVTRAYWEGEMGRRHPGITYQASATYSGQGKHIWAWAHTTDVRSSRGASKRSVAPPGSFNFQEAIVNSL